MRVVDVPVAELALAAVPSAVRFGRVFAWQTLQRWQLDCLVEDAELITSELVTNALQATGLTTAPERWSQLTDLAMIQVRLTRRESAVLIAVWDRSPAVPVFRTPADDEEGSRGLAIVEALADEWGYQHVSEGKIVWARLAIPGDAVAPVPLARRSVATELWGPRAVQAADDLALLERVRKGLLEL